MKHKTTKRLIGLMCTLKTLQVFKTSAGLFDGERVSFPFYIVDVKEDKVYLRLREAGIDVVYETDLSQISFESPLLESIKKGMDLVFNT